MAGLLSAPLKSITSGAGKVMSFFGNYKQGAGQAYEGGRSDLPELRNFHPGINFGDHEILENRDKIVARARDLVRNNGYVGGGVDRKVDAVMGSKIRLKCQISYVSMGQTPQWSFEWSRKTQEAFRVFTDSDQRWCDAERTQSFGMLCNTAYRHYIVDGEALAVIEDRQRGGKYTSCLRLIDPDRLCNPYNIPENTILKNGNRVIGGVEISAKDKSPVAYHIRVNHPADYAVTQDQLKWERIAARGPTGRPKVIHAFSKKRGSVTRGISQLADVIIGAKQMDRMDKATINAALLQTIFALFVSSEAPTQDIADALGAPADNEASHSNIIKTQLEYRGENPVQVGDVRAIQGLPNEKFEFKQPTHPHNNFEQFMQLQLKRIASSLGISYPQLSQDWAGINYSSARTLLNEIWRGLLDERHVFTQMFCTPFYAAWLEEAIVLRQTIELPEGALSFYKWRDELVRCDWMGPGRGTVDPKKEQEGSSIAIAGNRSSDQQECETHGLDVYEVYEQIAFEKALRADLGIPDADNDVGPGRPDQGTSEQPDSDVVDERELAGEQV